MHFEMNIETDMRQKKYLSKAKCNKVESQNNSTQPRLDEQNAYVNILKDLHRSFQLHPISKAILNY